MLYPLPYLTGSSELLVKGLALLAPVQQENDSSISCVVKMLLAQNHNTLSNTQA